MDQTIVIIKHFLVDLTPLYSIARQREREIGCSTIQTYFSMFGWIEFGWLHHLWSYNSLFSRCTCGNSFLQMYQPIFRQSKLHYLFPWAGNFTLIAQYWLVPGKNLAWFVSLIRRLLPSLLSTGWSREHIHDLLLEAQLEIYLHFLKLCNIFTEFLL